MKNAIVLLVLILVTSHAGASQISEIRELYTSVTDSIEEEVYYITSTKINSEEASYPAVGIYFECIDYFWDISFEFNYGPTIRFARINSQHSAIEEYHEFLFYDTGELAFAYRKIGVNPEFERFYFNKAGELIRYMYGDEIFDEIDSNLIEKSDEVLSRGNNLASSFDMIH